MRPSTPLAASNDVSRIGVVTPNVEFGIAMRQVVLDERQIALHHVRQLGGVFPLAPLQYGQLIGRFHDVLVDENNLALARPLVHTVEQEELIGME